MGGAPQGGGDARSAPGCFGAASSSSGAPGCFGGASSASEKAPLLLDRRAKAVVGETTRGAKATTSSPEDGGAFRGERRDGAGTELEHDPFAGAATDSEDDDSEEDASFRLGPDGPDAAGNRGAPPSSSRAARASSGPGDRPVHPALVFLILALSPFGVGLALGFPRAAAPTLLCGEDLGALGLDPAARCVPAARFAFLENLALAAAVPGALLAGRAADVAGRRATLRLASIAGAVGWAATLAFGAGTNGGLLGRAAVGAAGGAVSVAAPTLVAEIAPDRLRGPAIALCCAGAVALGQLAQCHASPVPRRAWSWGWGEENLPTTAAPHWRGAALLGGIWSAACAVAHSPSALGARLAPESPRWLAARGRNDAARHAVAAGWGLRADDPRAEAEAERLVREVRRGRARSLALAPSPPSPWHLVSRGGLSRPTLLALALVATAQLSGPDLGAYGEAAFASSAARVAGVLAGAATLAYHPRPGFAKGREGERGGGSGFGSGSGSGTSGSGSGSVGGEGGSPSSSSSSSSRVGGGRRFAFLASCSGAAFANVAACVSSLAAHAGAPEPGGFGASFAALFAFAHAFGLAHIPWLHVSESFRFDRRASATAFCAAAHWSYALDVSAATRAATSTAAGAAVTHGAFGLVCALGVTAVAPRGQLVVREGADGMSLEAAHEKLYREGRKTTTTIDVSWPGEGEERPGPGWELPMNRARTTV